VLDLSWINCPRGKAPVILLAASSGGPWQNRSSCFRGTTGGVGERQMLKEVAWRIWTAKIPGKYT